jgi:hypothetical protein
LREDRRRRSDRPLWADLADEVAGDGVGARVVPDGGQQKEWVSAAHPSECEVEASAVAAGDRYGWYLWKQSLHAGANRLRVRYLQRWFVQNGEVMVDYVLQTARAWGSGQIGNLHIELRDPDRPPKLRWKVTPQPTEVRDGGPPADLVADEPSTRA